MLRKLGRALTPYGGKEDDPDPKAGTLQAAVALVLRECPEPAILLVKRATSEKDPWSGHMALPGGRKDPRDASLLHTAVRETEEETALVLDPEGDHLGRLDFVRPQGASLPPMEVVPFVFTHPGSEREARVNSLEIAAVYWVPVSRLLDPASSGSLELPVEGATLRFPTFEVEGGTIWGLTYRILTGVLEPLAR